MRDSMVETHTYAHTRRPLPIAVGSWAVDPMQSPRAVDIQEDEVFLGLLSTAACPSLQDLEVMSTRCLEGMAYGL